MPETGVNGVNQDSDTCYDRAVEASHLGAPIGGAVAEIATITAAMAEAEIPPLSYETAIQAVSAYEVGQHTLGDHVLAPLIGSAEYAACETGNLLTDEAHHAAHTVLEYFEPSTPTHEEAAPPAWSSDLASSVDTSTETHSSGFSSLLNGASESPATDYAAGSPSGISSLFAESNAPVDTSADSQSSGFSSLFNGPSDTSSYDSSHSAFDSVASFGHDSFSPGGSISDHDSGSHDAGSTSGFGSDT